MVTVSAIVGTTLAHVPRMVEPMPQERSRAEEPVAHLAPGELLKDPSQGVSSQLAAERLSRYGPNVPIEKPAHRAWMHILSSMGDPMVLILAGAGALFLALGQVRDGTIMLVAVAPLLLVNGFLEVRAEGTLERLRELASPRATVRRDGRESEIPSEQLVPGDVILLSEGEIVPADSLVHSESNLQLDESALTGESLPQSKKSMGWPVAGPALEERDGRVYAGTTVAAGRATAIVLETGNRTEYGRVGALVAETRTGPTPLQKAIGRLVLILGIVAVIASVGVAGLGLARGAGWVEAILAGVSLSIAAIPEEFTIVFVLYLTLGSWRMARRNALVRTLAGVESLGSTTVICADKTGTLTEGHLSVGGVYVDGHLHLVGRLEETPAARRLLENALLASESKPFDPLDQAIASFATESGLPPSKVYPRWTMVRDYPFDEERKYVTHVWCSSEGEVRLCSKGSVEGILDLSLPPGTEREAVLQANQELASRGMRVIAVAEKTLARSYGERWADEAGMKLVGLLGFADPPRQGVRQCVEECQSAGVRVVMITGDHPVTAHAVAETVGLYHDDQDTLTGKDVEHLADKNLREALRKVAIFARVRPAQKFQIVRGLQAQGEIVAMTGDGINDAPALRAADMGIAMGRRGTQVAREAATMVLLDDNFGTIVEAIRQGRRIFDNLQRAFLYLMILPVPVVLIALVVPLVGTPLLLLPIHMVWLEMIVHPTAALVFEADPADPDLMRRPPRNPKKAFLSRRTGILAVSEGFAIFAAMLGLYLGFLNAGIGIDQARAVAIVTLIVAQTILVLQTRSPNQPFWRRGLLGNRVVVLAIVGTLGSLALMIYLAPLASAAQLAPPAPLQWAMAVGLAMVATVPFDLLKLRDPLRPLGRFLRNWRT